MWIRVERREMHSEHNSILNCDSSSKSVRDRVHLVHHPKRKLNSPCRITSLWKTYEMSRGGRGGFYRGGGELLHSLDGFDAVL